MVLDAIERVEVAIRQRITYVLAGKYGVFAHIDKNNFHPAFEKKEYFEWHKKLERETEHSKNEFILNYKKNFSGYPNILLWMAAEVMSFGTLSKFYKSLKNNQNSGITDKQDIANEFGLHYKILGNWIHSLTYVRNICAHHSRLWNKELAIKPIIPKDWRDYFVEGKSKIFTIMLILKYLMDRIVPDYLNNWHREVRHILQPIAENENHRRAMGLPEDWQEHSLWCL